MNGCGIAGSWKVGETIIFSAREGGGFVGTGVLMPLANPTFLLRLANMIRKVNAYLRLLMLITGMDDLEAPLPFGSYV